MVKASVVSALTLAIAFSACGGDDGGGGPSKAEFIEEADAICAEGSERAEQIAREGFSDPQNPTPEEVLAIVEQLIPLQRETTADVRALDKPEGEEDEINTLLDQADAATDRAEQEIDTPQEAVAVVQASDTPQDPFHEVNQAFAAYGFEACSE
jgi:hypothetical protein